MSYPTYDEREAVDRANGVLTAEDEAWQDAEKAMNQCQSTIARLNTDDGREQVYRSAVALTNYCHGVANECGWWKATNMAGGLNLDVAGAIADKMRYNTQRADHKLHNRENGGKRY